MKNLLLKNWKTTLFGIVSLVLFGLVSFGVLSPEQSEGLNLAVEQTVQAVDGGVSAQAVSSVFLIIGNALLLFVKDPDTKDTEQK